MRKNWAITHHHPPTHTHWTPLKLTGTFSLVSQLIFGVLFGKTAGPSWTPLNPPSLPNPATPLGPPAP